ncbi:DUF4372 domain-containing protein [Bacteroides fragilis]|nr:DUF4372 domain-containing protein [Bacteroides fragilis]MDA1474529.1 DUF4372 domain-containing protein [Bacteroides fragilis]MDA1481652.1 DUF4372 domain-containing protein [Bacteroides fragilis]
MNRTRFNNYVRKYDVNRYVKHFTYWNQIERGCPKRVPSNFFLFL